MKHLGIDFEKNSQDKVRNIQDKLLAMQNRQKKVCGP